MSSKIYTDNSVVNISQTDIAQYYREAQLRAFLEAQNKLCKSLKWLCSKSYREERISAQLNHLVSASHSGNLKSKL